MDPPTPWSTWAAAMWGAAVNQNLLYPDSVPAAQQLEHLAHRSQKPASSGPVNSRYRGSPFGGEPMSTIQPLKPKNKNRSPCRTSWRSVAVRAGLATAYAGDAGGASGRLDGPDLLCRRGPLRRVGWNARINACASSICTTTGLTARNGSSGSRPAVCAVPMSATSASPTPYQRRGSSSSAGAACSGNGGCGGAGTACVGGSSIGAGWSWLSSEPAGELFVGVGAVGDGDYRVERDRAAAGLGGQCPVGDRQRGGG